MRKSWILLSAVCCLIGCLAIVQSPSAVAMPGGGGSSCEGDIDGDGYVIVPDLLLVIGDWGDCAGCPTDLNGDDKVNVQDLLIVLGNFGPCEGEPCESEADCDDGDDCTIDVCIAGECFHFPNPACD